MSIDSNGSRSWVSLADKQLIRRQRLRLTLVNIVVLIVIWSALSLFVYTLLVNETLHSIDTRLAAAAEQVIEQQIATGLATWPAREPSPDGEVVFSIWDILTQPRWVVGNSVAPDLFNKLAAVAQTGVSTASYLNVSVHGTPYRVLQVDLAERPRRVLQVTANVSSQMGVLHNLLGLLLFGGMVGVLFTIVGGYSLGLWTLRPLMAARRREQEFVTDISHELRTPLSVMMTHLELLLRHVDDPLQEHLNWVEAIYGENQRMARLVDDLLEMARIEAGDQGVKLAPVSLSDLCEEVAAVFEPVIVEQGLMFRMVVPPSGYVYGDSMRLRQLLTILLDNARKYTLTGEIHLEVSRAAGNFDIVVRDTGVGIAADLLSKVTERFVRGDPARTRTKSTGLGLAIAKRIVQYHQGKLSIQSEVGKGTEVVVRLRAYDPQSDRLSK